MKSVASAALLSALAGSVTAFTPATTGKTVSSLKGSVFDDYVGAVDFRGKEFKWDPVSLSTAIDVIISLSHCLLQQYQL